MAGRMHLFSCSIAGSRPPAGSGGWDPACSGCSGILRHGCCLHEVPGCVGTARWPWARAGTAGHHHRLVMCPPVRGRGQETPSTSPPASPRGTQQEGLDRDPQSQRAPAPACPTARPGYRLSLSDYRNVFFFFFPAHNGQAFSGTARLLLRADKWPQTRACSLLAATTAGFGVLSSRPAPGLRGHGGARPAPLQSLGDGESRQRKV